MREMMLMRVAITAILVLAALPCRAGTKQDAKAHFDNGVGLFNNGDFDAALVEFRAAYQSQPHFAVRYNVGITLYKLHRYGEAHDELTAYIVEGGDEVPEDKKTEVESILQNLEALLGTLNVACDVDGAALIVDGEPRQSWSLRLEVGEHEIIVRAPGHETFEITVELPSGAVMDVSAMLTPQDGGTEGEPDPVEPAASKKKLKPAAFWSLLGVTGALAISSGITGGLVLKTRKDFSSMTYDDDWQPVQDRGRKLMIATDVLMGASAAAAVATIVVALLTDFEKEEDAALAPVISPLGLALRGTFP